jgi:hypothetical protein
MGRRGRCPGSPQAAPRTTACRDEAAPPVRLSARPAGRIARRLLVGAGLVVALWAFGALDRAHADALPARAHGGLVHSSAGLTRPVGRTARLVREAPPRRTTVRSLHRRLGLPRIARTTKAVGLPVIPHAVVSQKRAITAHLTTSGRGEPGCVRSRTARVPTTAHRQTTYAPSTGPPRAGARYARSPLRSKPTGAITHNPPRQTLRAGLAAPVPAPVSGSGEADRGGGKTPSGTGDAPSLARPSSELWTIARQPAVAVRRIRADQPSFSPD